MACDTLSAADPSAADPSAADPFADVPRLSRRAVAPGERWIYSAGFNVDPELKSTGRIDTEVPELARLRAAGARVAVLSHQGSHRDQSAGSLAHVAAYLGRQLGGPVGYCPDNAGDEAAETAARMRPGGIVVFGNTRRHPGEEQGAPALARRFAGLGERVAVGGFSKAHRAHASNTGLIGLLPGYATDSLMSEAAFLGPWARTAPGRRSAALLGGRKPEKTLVGLAHAVDGHDLVIPGGVVLNTLLRALGHDIGDSELGSRPDACLTAARRALDRTDAAGLHIPETVWVAPAGAGVGAPARPVAPADGVPPGYAIVDFTVRPWALDRLAASDSAVLAGTPCRYLDGHRRAADALLAALPDGGRSLLLGGDTVAELPWSGPTSTGGGSALELLATGTCAVFEALRAQAMGAAAGP
ncbi:phosphoglycerate kinase [Streptomyces sp. AC602_WCS936]|uniref:phosphoglycerate kinase n=1 Tax=Streptomyces sp. AC602_WCS936 TaxID=2823685 RepID=UPI001C251F21|nr:phosphoglycerate kinase [Streptomyces sp. AC602_WCS936]